MSTKIQITDEFLVNYYIDHVLPFVCPILDRRLPLKQALDRFIAPGRKFNDEIESTILFYQNLDSLSRCLKTLGSPQDKVEKLLKVIKKLQDFLFQIPYYRDHLPHQLRVYLLGCYILDSQLNFIATAISKKYGTMLAELVNKTDPAHKARILDSLQRGLICNPRILFDAWSVAGLCHDLGYSVEGISKLARDLNGTYKDLVPELNMQLNPQIIPSPVLLAQMESFKGLLANLFESGDELAKIVDLLASVDKMDHGVWSCFFLTSENLSKEIENKSKRLKEKMPKATIWDFLSNFNLVTGGGFSNDLLPVLDSEALVAIAFHNRAFLYRLSPISLLLVASDTMQEWNRIGRTRIELDCQKREVSLNFEFIGDELNIEPEINVYDCNPNDLFEKMRRDFQLSASESSVFDISKIEKDFVKNIKMTISVGPSSPTSSFSV
jgi:hypothetical protein